MNSPSMIIDEVVALGIKKSAYSNLQVLFLAFFGGLFIGLAGIASTIASTTIANQSLAKLISSLIFPFGLLMIVLTGTELFTSNSLIIISVLEKKVPLKRMMLNLLLVYLGNACGTIFTVLLLYFAKTFNMFGGLLGEYALNISELKNQVTFLQAFSSGILCNVLVCLAVWMSFATTKFSGKIFIIYFPVLLFVLCGFEHSIANFYYGPAGLAASYALDLDCNFTFFSFFLKNIIPATLGNIIGGAGLIGFGTWFLFKVKK